MNCHSATALLALDFPFWLRAAHYANLLFLTVLIRSGLEIFSAHPKLYWNDDCLPGSEWFNVNWLLLRPSKIPDCLRQRKVLPQPGAEGRQTQKGSGRLTLPVMFFGASYFRVNGRPPQDPEWLQMSQRGFSDYRLQVAGLVERPLSLSLADLRGLPLHRQVTKHCCIQGWSAVAEWGGVELWRILELCRPLAESRWIAVFAYDNKSVTEPHPAGPGYFYGTIHPRLARDPQTILAYEMNRQALPLVHGAPLRLRVETQLGFMMVKYIRMIEFIDDYRRLGLGQGGWREDYQFYSPEASI